MTFFVSLNRQQFQSPVQWVIEKRSASCILFSCYSKGTLFSGCWDSVLVTTCKRESLDSDLWFEMEGFPMSTSATDTSQILNRRRICPYSTVFASVSILASLLLVALVPGADSLTDTPNHSFDLGDFFALIIITGGTTGVICACLGKYARMRAAGLLWSNDA